MTAGTIVLDKQFKASDGILLTKLFVLLNDGCCGFYVVVKTTSNGKQYSYTPGCQPLGRFRCFHIPQGMASFPKDTWVQLEEFYEFPSTQFDAACPGTRFRVLDVLPPELRTELVTCALGSDDITPCWANAICPFAQ